MALKHRILYLPTTVISWVRVFRRWYGVVDICSVFALVHLLRTRWRAETAAADAKIRQSVRLSALGSEAVIARDYSSDLDVLDEVSVRQVYAPLRALCPKPRYIVDCGANAGYSSLFFLHMFPASKLLAIEPDRGNFDVCCANLSRYIEEGRATVIRAALWKSNKEVLIASTGPEWARVVADTSSMTPGASEGVPGYSLDRLFQLSDFPEIDLLKIDIEGAEREVFASGLAREVLCNVNSIAIELHGPDCEAAFYSAVRHKDYTFTSSGAYVLALSPTCHNNHKI